MYRGVAEAQFRQERIEALCEGLNLIERAYHHEHFVHVPPATYSCDWQGRKYLRIVRNDTNQRLVEMFIEAATGDVFYPAGWKAPAKHVRGNIYDDTSREVLLARKWLNHYGYLYLDSIKESDRYIRDQENRVLFGLLSSALGF